jgi:chemotaxis protein MotB
MNRLNWALVAVALCGCGVSRSDYDAKVQEAEAAKKDLEAAKHKASDLEKEVASDNQQLSDMKNSLGLAQSQAITDEQKSQLEEAKRAVSEAQERGKLLEELQTKLKRMIDAGHLKITTRHGRAVLQLHNDVLFDVGETEVKPAGKQALAEVAHVLRALNGRRFQVAGHTDAEAITPATKKRYPTNWELSAARAIAVVKLLVQEGVEPAMLSAAGYGPYDAVAANSSAEGQARNRRIEITVMPNMAQLVVAAESPKKP